MLGTNDIMVSSQPACLNHLTALSVEKTVTSARFPPTHSQIQARGKKGTLRGAKRSNADVPTIVRQVLGQTQGDSYTSSQPPGVRAHNNEKPLLSL